MKKNQESIQQLLESFDEKLTKLFHLKIHTEMAIQEVRYEIHNRNNSIYTYLTSNPHCMKHNT